VTHVFLSYVREDQALIDRLVGDLTDRGIKVWLDRQDIAPGVHWKDAIRKAIRTGDYFIACFSIHYHRKTKTYMNHELALAIEELSQFPARRSWFLPVLLSGQEVPDRSIPGGGSLCDLQYVDLGADWYGGIDRLVRAIQGNEALIEGLDVDYDSPSPTIQKKIVDIPQPPPIIHAFWDRVWDAYTTVFARTMIATAATALVFSALEIAKLRNGIDVSHQLAMLWALAVGVFSYLLFHLMRKILYDRSEQVVGYVDGHADPNADKLSDAASRRHRFIGRFLLVIYFAAISAVVLFVSNRRSMEVVPSPRQEAREIITNAIREHDVTEFSSSSANTLLEDILTMIGSTQPERAEARNEMYNLRRLEMQVCWSRHDVRKHTTYRGTVIEQFRNYPSVGSFKMLQCSDVPISNFRERIHAYELDSRIELNVDDTIQIPNRGGVQGVCYGFTVHDTQKFNSTQINFRTIVNWPGALYRDPDAVIVDCSSFAIPIDTVHVDILTDTRLIHTAVYQVMLEEDCRLKQVKTLTSPVEYYKNIDIKSLPSHIDNTWFDWDVIANIRHAAEIEIMEAEGLFIIVVWREAN
jgi:hypothetical protein